MYVEVKDWKLLFYVKVCSIASCAMSNKNLISDWDHCFCMYTSFHDQHEHYMTWQKKKDSKESKLSLPI